LAAVSATAIVTALGSAFLVASIIGAWLLWHIRPKLAAAQTWLLDQSLDAALRNALTPVLTEMWAQAWAVGAEAAADLAQSTGIPFKSSDFLERYGRQWVNEIVQTRLDGLARILAEGPEDKAALIQAVTAYLSDADQAHLIAVTEITRAINIAAHETYSRAGIFEVRWQTEDADACAQCLANQDAGPRPLGMPFPSGATAPPQHPRCRCALLPA
jgi:hypothetical protein